LDKIDSSKLNSICTQRYKYFDSIAFFDTYKKKLDEVGCPEIKSEDISASILELSEKVIGKAPYITELHEKSIKQNSLRLASKNNFSLEQIINEIIPLELEEKMGKDLNDPEIINELKEKFSLSDEILNFFKKSNKKVNVRKSKEVSNIERIIKHFNSEVPEEYLDKLLNFARTNLVKEKFNFISTSFPLEELGDNIIKALYIWDPDKTEIAKNYKNFFMLVEEELMDKNLILAEVASGAFSSSSKEDDGWNEVFTNGD